MEIHRSFETLTPARPTVLTIGVFDGVHRGHQRLITQAIERARQIDGVSAVMTFDPHPDTVLHAERQRRSLCDLQQRLHLIAALGVDHCIVLPFTAELSRRTAEQFTEQLCTCLQLRELWVGYDFRLGHRGAGTVPVLQELGRRLNFTVHPVAAELIDGQPISSTLIRQQLASGAVEAAALALGRPFAVHGQVVKGDQRGRTIGFPTANVATAPEQLLPADGVYACRIRVMSDTEFHAAVTNVGVRPTFGVLGRTVEAHLLNWSGDLYGKDLEVTFVARLRGEQKFSGVDALVAQIQADAAVAAQVLAAAS